MSCFIEGSSVGGHVGREETINFVQVFQKWDRVGCFPRELAPKLFRKKWANGNEMVFICSVQCRCSSSPCH